jgi:serine/threonine protein kinase
MQRDDPAHDDRLLDLARRLLDGEAIDWEKEDVAESEVREGMKQLEKIIGRRGEVTETRRGADSELTVPPAPTSPPRPGEDRVIGGFRLVRKLGEGGMGVVYEAQQSHPRRLVALKVIRGGALVSPDTLKLFRREIQTLARLSHSGIAQLYEAGVTDDGMHFFAMELVRGEPLSDWLRSRPKGPTTPAEIKLRLGVFRKICDAVAYAHQKGVIHRDLKPGNILIPKPVEGASIQDAVPEVKVLDFGLARITDSDVQATTFVTEMGKVQGTLPYMSPEQVRGNPDEIDLRTDVYALGVILYEMVAGRLPYDISKAQLHDAVRIICETPPRSLTTTFVGTRQLDADVITIAAKCLEKESARRYQSAAALGEEVQRYLTHQPILARPPSAAYQFRKLVARHKAAFGTIAAVFVLLLGTTVAVTVQARRIALERDRANREAATQKLVSEFLDSVFQSPGLLEANQAAKTEEVLAVGAARIDRELAGAPLVQAQLMNTIANVYKGLGYRDQAKALIEKERIHPCWPRASWFWAVCPRSNGRLRSRRRISVLTTRRSPLCSTTWPKLLLGLETMPGLRNWPAGASRSLKETRRLTHASCHGASLHSATGSWR